MRELWVALAALPYFPPNATLGESPRSGLRLGRRWVTLAAHTNLLRRLHRRLHRRRQARAVRGAMKKRAVRVSSHLPVSPCSL